MSRETVQAAIMFADVAGSTRLYSELGDERASTAVNRCLEFLNQVAMQFSGRKIKTIGDEIMCRFPDADSAVNAALEMQRGMAQVPRGLDVPLKIKIGLHFGPMLEAGGDVFGDAVNIAARMTSIARADQIILTESTTKHLADELQQATRQFDAAPVKGIKGLVHICEVVWEDQNVTAMLTTPVGGLGANSQSLRLKCQQRSIILQAGDNPCVLGRDLECGFIVPSEYASRRHAVIEHRRGKFVLIDQSTNGTYVRVNGESTSSEMYLRREELPLLGSSGLIGLGASLEVVDEFAVQFDCL
ncbi:MAG: adenylate/guanylate cyclase domain-containing protein [Oceanococcus sp.]